MKTPFDPRRLVVCAMLAASVQAQHGSRGVETPRVGKMVDAQGALRSVSGVAGNFLAGPVEAQGVVALDCSRQACITAPDTEVLATDGKRAVAYLPATSEFMGWNLGGRSPPESFSWNPVTDGDKVLSLRLTLAGAEIAIRRGGAVWIVSQDGSALGTLPADATGAVLLLDAGAVYARQDAVVVCRADGTETSFPVQGIRALYRMSPDWVEAVAPGALYAVRTTAGREGAYVLPGGSQ
jgi:hypothetical protein